MSYAAYTKVQNVAENGKDIEYRLLGQVTAALMGADKFGSSMKMVADAVLWNRDVWATFRLDLTHAENGLPQSLKKQLVDLSFWIERETRDVLDSRSDLKTLIEVNRNIMEGLKPKTNVEEDASFAVPA